MFRPKTVWDPARIVRFSCASGVVYRASTGSTCFRPITLLWGYFFTWFVRGCTCFWVDMDKVYLFLSQRGQGVPVFESIWTRCTCFWVNVDEVYLFLSQYGQGVPVFGYSPKKKTVNVCVLHIEHTQCPCRFLILEIQALWSRNYDTGRYVVDSSGAMPCYCAQGYDRHHIHTPAVPIHWTREKWKTKKLQEKQTYKRTGSI